MPRYTYRCDSCKETFEVSHGMFFEQTQCASCHTEGFLTKVPVFNIKKSSTEEKEKAPGHVVDTFIKDAKQDLKKQRKELKTEILDK